MSFVSQSGSALWGFPLSAVPDAYVVPMGLTALLVVFPIHFQAHALALVKYQKIHL
jgi:hypothetical protein